MLTVLLTSPRVAPGLLTFQAWSLLRAAERVAAPPGHPQLAALAAAGIACAESAEPSFDDGVWLAPPGSFAVPAGAVAVTGSADLPGAHLLDLVATMDRLRTGCPWDAKQTHQSLAPYLLEEPYEALDALESGDLAAFREELGDVLLQVVFHARVADDFTVDDVADGIVAKLVRRHPHVFGDVRVAGAEEVTRNWDAIKMQERAERAGVPGSGNGLRPEVDGVSLASTSGPGESRAPLAPSALDGVPFGQPALSLAAQLQRRAERAGAPADLAGDVAGDGVGEPGGPGESGVSGGSGIGSELFRLVARAREAGLDPELELRAAARRYRERVHAWERERR